MFLDPETQEVECIILLVLPHMFPKGDPTVAPSCLIPHFNM